MKAVSGKPFFRGVKLKGRKSPTDESPIERIPLPEEVVIPLKQGIGGVATPTVSAGDPVKRGTLLGAIEGLGTNVHASVAGTVKAIEERDDGKGNLILSVVIARSEEQETQLLPPLASPAAEEIIARVAEAGILGMGGAGFPTARKLTPKHPVTTLLLNGAECEPYLTCDDRLMREEREKILRGAEYLKTALGASEIVIAIEKNKPASLALFEDTPYRVVALKKQYPMGSEKHLIYCCTGKVVPQGGLPSDIGVSVQNVATAFAVCEAVEEGIPLIERVVTVAGGGIQTPKNLRCPVGTPLSALAAYCGIGDNAVKYVVGGPMTGAALTGLNAPVTKTTSGLLLLTKKETNSDAPTPCINCGKCAEVCPMRLLPMQTAFYASAKEYENAAKYGGVLSCIECGACSYICPARRPLAQAIKTAKAELKKAANAQTGGKQ